MNRFLLSSSILLILTACATPVTPSATLAPDTLSTATSAVTPEPTAILGTQFIASFDGESLSVAPEECNGAYVGLIQSVVATDAQTVTFTLCRPEPDFLFKISLAAFAIYPSEWIEEAAKDGARTNEALDGPIGTGPYVVSEWTRGESLTLIANGEYWGGMPVSPTALVRWSSDPAARLAELQAGIVDGIDLVRPDDFITARSDPFVALLERPKLRLHELELIQPLAGLAQFANEPSGAAYRADVINAQASPLGAEMFHLMAPGDRPEFIWLQSAEPSSLFCADEAEVASLRICAQVAETLYRFDLNTATPIPTLAQSCDPNADRTVWVCALREGVAFHDGSEFDAADVVATFDMGLNPASPFHAGRAGLWEFFQQVWGLMQRPG
ncbi:MAG: ABC transporter substrate-binding protein [Chloroflexota bacterium]